MSPNDDQRQKHMAAKACRLSLLFAVYSWLCAYSVASAALPDDSNAITTLSPVDARALIAREAGAGNSALQLNGLTSLSPEIAALLAGSNMDLVLGGIKELSGAAAGALAQSSNAIVLSGIQDLTVETASALGKINSEVRLPGVVKLEGKALQQLTKVPATLVMDGLRTLEESEERVLAKSKGTIHLASLNRVQTLELAKKFATQPADINLPFVQKVDTAVADVLAASQRRILLPGLVELNSAALARRLVGNAGPGIAIELFNVAVMDEESAKAIGETSSDLFLPSFRSFAGNVETQRRAARALGEHYGVLRLDQFDTEDPETLAGILCNKGPLGLPAVSQLFKGPAVPKSVLEALASHRYSLGLGGVTTISGELAVALRDHHGYVDLPQVLVLGPEEAKAMCGCKGVIQLPGLDEVRSMEETVRILLGHKSNSGEGFVLPPTVRDQVAAVLPELAEACDKHRGIHFGNTVAKGGPTVDRPMRRPTR